MGGEIGLRRPWFLGILSGDLAWKGRIMLARSPPLIREFSERFDCR